MTYHHTFAGKGPKWARTIIERDNGDLFIPPAFGVPDMEVFLCATWSGVDILQIKDRVYYNLGWVEKEFQHIDLDCGALRKMVVKSNEHHDGEGM